jgi:glycosyltransferase involved in cell wall biosynthesis
MDPRRARVAFFPLRREVEPTGELESSKSFLNILRRSAVGVEVVDLTEAGDISRGLASLVLGNLRRLAGIRKTLRAAAFDLAVIKVPTPAQIPPLRPLLFDFQGKLAFWCDSLCFELPSLRLALTLLAQEPLLTGARAVLNGRSWLRLGGPRGGWIVVATEVQRAQLRAQGWDPTFIRVIPNSSNLVRAESAPRPSLVSPISAPFRMGYMGHLDSVKGVSDLFTGLAELLREPTPFSFHFAVSPLSTHRSVPEFHDPRIKISHAVDRLVFLNNLDLLVLPYWADWGTSLVPAVLLEAMGLGVPVLVPDTPLSREVLGEDYPGLYARTDGTALQRAMMRVLTDVHHRPNGAALRERFLTRYSPRRVEEAWLAFLDEALRVG